MQHLLTLPSPLSPTTILLWCLYSKLVYAAAAHLAESALSDDHEIELESLPDRLPVHLVRQAAEPHVPLGL